MKKGKDIVAEIQKARETVKELEKAVEMLEDEMGAATTPVLVLQGILREKNTALLKLENAEWREPLQEPVFK